MCYRLQKAFGPAVGESHAERMRRADRGDTVVPDLLQIGTVPNWSRVPACRSAAPDAGDLAFLIQINIQTIKSVIHCHDRSGRQDAGGRVDVLAFKGAARFAHEVLQRIGTAAFGGIGRGFAIRLTGRKGDCPDPKKNKPLHGITLRCVFA